MHLLDCGGVAALVAGSVIHRLVLDCRALGMTQQARMHAINHRLHLWQRNRGTSRMPPLKLSNLIQDGWACLTGPAIKAANTRSILPFLVEPPMIFLMQSRSMAAQSSES